MAQARSFRTSYRLGEPDRMKDCGVVLVVEEPRQPDVLDIRMLVAAAVDGYCHEFGLCGAAARFRVLRSIASEAREMAAEL